MIQPRFLIYGLIDPRDGQLRYVGKSCSGLRRPRRHEWTSALGREDTRKARWVRQLQAEGLTYEVEVLEEHESAETLSEAERFYIAYFRGLGCRLTNLTDGGDGQSHTYRPSAATRAKLSVSLRGRRRSVAQREKIRLSKLKITEDQRKSIVRMAETMSEREIAKALGISRTPVSQTLQGVLRRKYVWTEEHRRNGSLAHRKLTDEQRIGIREAALKMSQRAVGKMFGVSPWMVSDIVNSEAT